MGFRASVCLCASASIVSFCDRNVPGVVLFDDDVVVVPECL